MSKDPYPLVRKIVDAAATAAKTEIQQLAMTGLLEPFQLYFKPATDLGAGELKLFRQSTPPDSFWTLATDDKLNINIPYDSYFTWIHCRVQRLPILPKVW